jgi:hypothetical protein
MGKVIRKKINGMRLWAKAGLVVSITLLLSVFMYHGLHKPLQSQAASTDMLHNSTTTGKNPWVNNATGWGVAGGKYGAFTCATCHSNSTVDTGTNIKRIRASVSPPLGNWSTNSASVASKVISFRNVTSMGREDSGHTDSTRVCQACHIRTNKHNQTQARSTGSTTHNNGVDCTNCHSHNSGFKGAGECLTCHDKVTGTAPDQRAAIVLQFNNGATTGNSHHIQGVTLTNAHCYQCHMEADAAGNQTSYHKGSPGGAVNLVVYGANGVRGTNFISYTASILRTGTPAQKRASVSKLNNHCLSCHNISNKTFTAGTLNVTARNYFNDGKSPAQYAWDNLSSSIDQRYSNANTVNWSQLAGIASTGTTQTVTNQSIVNIYGGNKKNSIVKALSAHGRADLNQRGFNTYSSTGTGGKANTGGRGDEPWANTSGAVQVACYDCHNSHGSFVEGGAGVTSYTSATTTGGILKDVTAGQGGYSVSYRPYSGGSAAAPNKNKHLASAGLCFDCHNTMSEATVSKVVGGTTYSTPWGYYDTFNSTQRIHGYIDTPDFGNYSTGSTTVREWNGAQKRYPVKQLGSGSLNQGGHFGASVTMTAGTTSGTIGGICTKCHDPHGVTSDTTKVSATMYGVPLLKGNWMTSPYREDAPPAATTHTRGGGDGAGVIATASIPRYRIDQNTFGATSTMFSGGGSLSAPTGVGAGGNGIYWNFTMPTGNVTQTAAQFGGLCLSSASGGTGCHVEASIKQAQTAAATSTTWRTMTRVHNTVKGWASTVAGGGNANNAVHAFTCSKCHAPHNSNLPRLLVTNCLDWKHRAHTATGGSISSTTGSAATANQNRGASGSGMGAGRFPGGGARYYAGATGNTRNSNSGTWFFGTKRTAVGGTATSGYTFAERPCHESATAGGAYPSATFPTAQLWNTKSTW